MRIAIASGKGGTGKTTVAVNMAAVAARHREDVTYIDCDVEEPNGHIFFKPTVEKIETVMVPVPRVDDSKCTYCGECGSICQYKAIVSILNKVLTFPELCHGCGGCTLVCQDGAITEIPRAVGKVEIGSVHFSDETGLMNGKHLGMVQGVLDVKEAMPGPVIRRVKAYIPDSGLRIIDAPPGTSCPVVESVRGSDYVLLVTEPTPFGLHDLTIAVETVREMGLPMGVVINRADIGDDRVTRYCKSERITVLAEIPDDRRVAEVYSRGGIIVDAISWFAECMQGLLQRLSEEVAV